MSANPKFPLLYDFPCNKLDKSIRQRVLIYFKRHNIKAKKITVRLGDKQSFKPHYIPITLDNLYKLKDLVSYRVKCIDIAICILENKEDPRDIYRLTNADWDRRCGFKENTFSVMKSLQPIKYRYINMLGRENLQKGWEIYKQKMRDMVDFVLEYGQSYPTQKEYIEAIDKYRNKPSKYIIKRLEEYGIGECWSIRTYRNVLSIVKAIRKLEKENEIQNG